APGQAHARDLPRARARCEPRGLLADLVPRGPLERTVRAVLARGERPLRPAAEIVREGRRAATALVADLNRPGAAAVVEVGRAVDLVGQGHVEREGLGLRRLRAAVVVLVRRRVADRDRPGAGGVAALAGDHVVLHIAGDGVHGGAHDPLERDGVRPGAVAATAAAAAAATTAASAAGAGRVADAAADGAGQEEGEEGG